MAVFSLSLPHRKKGQVGDGTGKCHWATIPTGSSPEPFLTSSLFRRVCHWIRDGIEPRCAHVFAVLHGCVTFISNSTATHIVVVAALAITSHTKVSLQSKTEKNDL